MLLTFHENPSINRKSFVESVGIGGEEAKEVLAKVAKLEVPQRSAALSRSALPRADSIMQPGSGWVLKLPADASFATRFPQLVAKYDKFWADRRRACVFQHLWSPAGGLRFVRAAFWMRSRARRQRQGRLRRMEQRR